MQSQGNDLFFMKLEEKRRFCYQGLRMVTFKKWWNLYKDVVESERSG